MNNTFRLGRIAGVPIGLSWTWIPVFGLFVWSLAVSVFPSTDPGMARGTYVAMAVAAALLFFGSILLHELGHALSARREGVAIVSITLWLLGGVARFRGRFPSAGAEFRIAIAGPLVTAALAASFGALAVLTHLGGALDGVLVWLGFVNLLLLVFNLLPALPLDGGRIFRAALWRMRGDLAWATRIAAATGVGIGGLLIAAGIPMAFTTSTFSGAWLAVIGVFVLGAALNEARLVSLQGALEGFVVADLMAPHPTVSQAEQNLDEFMATTAADASSTSYPVLEGLRPVGILPSPRRFAGHARTTLRVRDRMVRLDDVPSLAADEPAADAIRAMVEADADNALVMDEGRLAGIVSSRDINDALKVGARRLRTMREDAHPRSGRPSVGRLSAVWSDGDAIGEVHGRDRPSARVADDGQPPTRDFDPRLLRRQSDVTGGETITSHSGVEAGPVVGDAQLDPFVALHASDVHVAGAGVLCDVGQQLSRRCEQEPLLRRVRLGLVGHMRAEPTHATRPAGNHRQGRLEAPLLQHQRMQIRDDLAQLSDRREDGRLRAIEGWVVDGLGDLLEIVPRREQILERGVVEGFGERLAFSLFRTHRVGEQLARLQGELADLAGPASEDEREKRRRDGDPDQVAGLDRDESGRPILVQRGMAERLGQVGHDDCGPADGGQRGSEPEGECDRDQGVRDPRLREAPARKECERRDRRDVHRGRQ